MGQRRCKHSLTQTDTMEELATGGSDGLSSRQDGKSTFEDHSIDTSFLSSARGFWTQKEWGSLTVLISILVVCVTVWHIHRASQQRRRKLPPGPWRWPVLGNLPNLAAGDLPHRTLWALSNKFGGLMYMQLGRYFHGDLSTFCCSSLSEVTGAVVLLPASAFNEGFISETHSDPTWK